MTTPATLDPSQWARLQRGEEVEIRERMDWASSFRPPDKIVQLVTGGFRGRWFGNDSVAERDLSCPHAIGDKIAMVCPRCGGNGGFQEGTGYPSSEGGEAWRYEPCVTCYELGSIGTTVRSITARQVDGAWFWVLGVKLEDA